MKTSNTFTRENKKPPYSKMNTEDEKTRGTTSIYRNLAITAFPSANQHSRSVTGTPVAAYSVNPFGALLAECIQQERPHCLAPPDNSLKASKMPTCFCSNAFFSILSHSDNEVKSKIRIFYIFLESEKFLLLFVKNCCIIV
jgi:hypothetical protein